MLVIARAYMDQPLERVVTGVNEKVIYVAAPSPEYATGYPQYFGVGFPRGALFEHDSRLFESLRTAWERGDAAELAALWEIATPLEIDAKAFA